MIVVRPSCDLAYCQSVLARPGIWRMAAAVAEPLPAVAVLEQPGTMLYEVTDGAERRGFILFRRSPDPTIVEMHTALLTLGQRTVQALGAALASIARRGVRRVYAIYPAGHRAIDRLAGHFGFVDMPLPVPTHFFTQPMTCKLKEIF